MNQTSFKSMGCYSLKQVVFSHGWSDLVPFRVLDKDGTVRISLRTQKGIVNAIVKSNDGGIELQTDAKITDDIKKSVEWMFRLGDDLSPFYNEAKSSNRDWIAKGSMGRLLRSQTVFEDLIKLILTTNCSWSFTRIMTDNLARMLGDKTDDGTFLFPTPEAMAKKPEAFYRNKIRSGYRSPHLVTISRSIVTKKFDPEKWKGTELSTEELRKEILAVPGAGPYVADNLLRFLGRYDRLGLDSWARGKLKELWKMKKNPSDKTIERKYKPHGSYRGLILWCDLTRDWFEKDQFSDWIRTPASKDAS